MSTLAPAILGAAIGFAIAENNEVRETAEILVSMYVLFGAIGGVFVMRVGLLLVEMIRDFMGGS